MNKNQINLIFGNDIKDMAIKLCEESKLSEHIKEQRVIIKPNLVNSTDPSYGATTHPEIVEGIIEYLFKNEIKNIVIAEGSWIGDDTKRAFKVCGYEEISKKYNIDLCDTKKEKGKTVKVDTLNLSIVNMYDKEDFLINVPVMKAHCQTVLTCALKNMKGLIPDSEKRRFHTMGLHKPIAYLNKGIRQDFIIVDAICGDLDFEEGGNPVPMNMMFSATDPVLCDSYACQLMGIDISEVEYMEIAQRIGVGSLDIKNADIKFLNKGTPVKYKSPRRAKQYESNINEFNACSACYGSLIHALSRTKKINEKISIGQGFKGKTGSLGVGNCTSGFEKYVKGCPPTGKEIIEFLNALE